MNVVGTQMGPYFFDRDAIEYRVAPRWVLRELGIGVTPAERNQQRRERFWREWELAMAPFRRDWARCVR